MVSAQTRHFAVSLKRSGLGMPLTQRKTLLGLGLRKMGKTVFLKDTPQVRGMLYKVVHLVAVKTHVGVPPPSRRAQTRA